MLEQKLIVDRLINLNVEGIAPPRYADGDFVLVKVQDYNIEESDGKSVKTSQIAKGKNPKAHRNFKWLPWLPGAISEVAFNGTDVLTGPMSGCWLVSYKKGNGVPHAGHLGTDIASKPKTDAVNTAWNNFATNNAADVIGGFNPLRHWNGKMPKAKPTDQSAPKIFGLYTVDNHFHIIVAYPQKDAPTTIRIAGVQEVRSVTVARLQHVDTAGP